MESNKVKLSREQDELIKHYLSDRKYSKQEILHNRDRDIWPNDEETSTMKGISFDDLASALYIGYEVEQTPEQWISNEFEKHIVSNAEWSLGYCKGLEMAVERLGIKVSGINS